MLYALGYAAANTAGGVGICAYRYKMSAEIAEHFNYKAVGILAVYLAEERAVCLKRYTLADYSAENLSIFAL